MPFRVVRILFLLAVYLPICSATSFPSLLPLMQLRKRQTVVLYVATFMALITIYNNYKYISIGYGPGFTQPQGKPANIKHI